VQVLDDTTFAIFVIMALTTTPFMTALYRRTLTATAPETRRAIKGGDACLPGLASSSGEVQT